MSDFEPIEIQIQASATKAKSELDKVDSSLASIQTKIQSISGLLNGVTGKGSTVASSMRQLADALKGINPSNAKEASKSIDAMATSADKTEKKVKGVSDSVKELNRDLSQTNSASTFEKMLPALAQVNDYMSAFNSWVDRCFNRDIGADSFGRQLREIPQIMQEITASNGVSVITSQFQTSIPLIEEATNGMISFDKWVKDAFKNDIGVNNFAKDFNMLETSIGTAIVPFSNFIDLMKQAEVETTDFTTVFEMGFGGVPAVINQSLGGVPAVIDQLSQDIKIRLKSALEGLFDEPIYAENIETLKEEIDDIEEVYSNFQEPVKIFDDKVLGSIESVREQISDLDNQIKELEQSYADLQKMFASGDTEGYTKNYKSVLFREKEVMAQLLPMLKERKELLESIQINRSNSLASFMESDAGLRIDKEKSAEASKLLAEFDKLQAKEQQLVETGEAFKNSIGETASKFKDFSEEVKSIPKIDLNGGKSNTEIEQLIAKIRKLRELLSGMKSGAIQGFSDDQFRDLNTQLAAAQARLHDITGTMGKARSDSWQDVIKDIERMQRDYGKLSETIGDFNAQMQIAQDITNRVKSAMSSTKSGKMIIDVENMRTANEYLREADQSLKIFYDQFKEPIKMDTVQPRSELGKLYERAKELKELLDSMRNNRVHFDTSDVQRSIKELNDVNEKIKVLENGESASKASDGTKKGSLEWMASLMAVQHQLEKMSQTFDRFGEIAKKAFLKALTPLKLFKHEFEEIKGLITMVSRVGSAFAMISKPITKVFRKMHGEIDKLVAKIQKAWGKVMRTFTFMLIRKAITHIISTINDAIVSLASFSKDIGTSFNDSMSLITSDLRYIGASLVAMFEPIINHFTPAFDSLADAIVAVINKVNMFLAIITGAKSYTIAKKKIVDYTDSVKKANKAVKQLTLGIDELNILNDNSNEEQTPESLFDWQELATPQIEIPDWLKWIKELLKKIWEALKEFFKALWDAIKDAWERVKDFFLKALKHLIEAIVGLILDILRDLTRLFNTEKFREFLARLMRIIAKIMEFIAIIIDKIREAWNYNELGYRILEAILDILNTIAIHIENILDMMIEWAHSITFVPLFEAVLKVLQQINYAVDQIGYVAEDVAAIVLGILKLFIEDYLPRLLRIIGNIIEGIGNIAKKLHEAITEINFRERFVEAFDGIVQAIMPHLEEVGEYFKAWALSLDFKPVLEAIIKLMESLKPVADFVGGVFEDLVKDYILPMVKHLIEEVIPKIGLAIANFADAVDWNKLRKNIDKVIKAFEHVSAAIGEGVAKALDKMGQLFAKFINSKEFSDFVDTITGFMEKVDGELVAKILEAIGTAIMKIAQALMKFVNNKTFKDFLNSLINFVKTKSVDQLANLLLDIAGAFLAFKGLSFLGKAGTAILNFVALLGKAAEGLTALKGLFGGVEAASAASSSGIVASFAPVLGALAIVTTAVYSMISSFGGVIELVDELEGHFKDIIGLLKQVAKSIGLDTALKKLGESIKRLIKSIKEMLKSLGDLKAFWEIFFDVAEVFYKIMGTSIVVAIRAVVAALEILVNGIRGCIEVVKLFIEIIGGVAEVVHGLVTGDMEEAADGIKRIWQGVADFFAAMWQGIYDNFSTFINFIIDIVKGFVEGVFNFFKWLKYVLIGDPIVIDMWEGILNIFSESIGKIIEFVQGLVEAIVQWFIDLWNKAVEIWNAIVDGIIEIWHSFVEKMAEVWVIIQDWFTTTWEAFKTWVKETWDAIVQTIIDCWNALVAGIQAIWDAFYSWLSATWEAFKEWANEIWTTITTIIRELWDNLMKALNELWTKFRDWITEEWNKFKDFAEKLWAALRDFIVKCWEFVKKKTQEIWGAIKKFLMDLWEELKNKVKVVFEFIKQKILEVWEKIHQKTVEIWSAIKGFLLSTWQAIKDFCNEIFSWIRDFLLNIWKWIQSIWEHTWTGIRNMLEDIWTQIKTIATAIYTALRIFLDTIWDGLEEWWHKVWEGIAEAIKSVWEWLVQKAEEKYRDIKDKINTKWLEIKAEAEVRWQAITDMLKLKWNNLKDLAEKVFNELAHVIWVAWTKIKDTVKSTWDGVKEFIHGLADETQSLVGKLENAINKLIELKNKKKEAFDDQPVEKSGTPPWKMYADGGFPKQGEIFIANEKGAELVGKLGSKSAVANQSQITEAIENAVEEVMGDISEEIEVAMRKLVAEVEAGMNKIVEKLELLSDRIVESMNTLTKEVQFTRATVHEMIKLEMDLLKSIATKASGVLQAVAKETIESNRDLETAYKTDDSAVKSAISRMSQSYEFSNDMLVEYFQELGDTIKGGFDSLNGTVESGFESMVASQKEMTAIMDNLSSTGISTLSSMDTITNRAQDNEAVNNVAAAVDNCRQSVNDIGDLMLTDMELFGKGVEYILEMLGHIGEEIQALGQAVDFGTKSLIAQIQAFKRTVGEGFGIPTYATGGFPEDGWFRASHGEIMGRFDNGQSVVANNNQITAGIAQAVSQSLVPILNDIAESNHTIAEKEMSINVDSREIAKANNTGQTRLGKSLISFT